MAKITVDIEDSKAALLREKAEKYGLLPDQFVTVLSKNKELYKRLS